MNHYIEKAARCMSLLSLFLIPISTAGVNIVSTLFVLLALSSFCFWQTLTQLGRTPIVYFSLGMLLLMAVGLLWTPISLNLAWPWVVKYRKLLFIPLLLPFFQTNEMKRRAIWVLLTSLTLVLLISYSNGMGLTSIGTAYVDDNLKRAWVFKHHITQSFFTLMIVPIAIWMASTLRYKNMHYLLYVLTGLAIFNLFFLLQSRTGHLLGIVAMLYIVGDFLKGRKIKIHYLLSIAIAIGLSIFLITQMQPIQKITQEIDRYSDKGELTSSGLRLAFYTKSLLLLQQAPFIGHGIGSIEPLFYVLGKHHTGAAAMVTANPHNEFLAFGIQYGFLGIMVFIFLLTAACHSVRQSTQPYSKIGTIFCFLFILGCLFNSFLMDFPEGFMFAFIVGMLGSLKKGKSDI